MPQNYYTKTMTLRFKTNKDMQAVRHDRTAQQTNLCFKGYFILTFHTVMHATGCQRLVNISLQNKYAVLFCKNLSRPKLS